MIRILICTAALLASGLARAETLKALTPAIETEMARTHVPGVVAVTIADCRIAEQRAWGTRGAWSVTPMTPTTRLQGASLGKPIAAFAILQLANGANAPIALDRPLDRAVFEIAGSGRGPTVAELLSHRSGLPNSPMAGRKPAFPPGARFSYSGTGFRVAQEAAERATGEPFQRIAETRVFQPLGMTASSYVDDAGVPRGSIGAGALLGFAGAPWGAATLVALLVGLGLTRWRRGYWQTPPGLIAAAGLIGALAVTMLFARFMGAPAMPTISGLFLAVTLVGYLAALLARRLSWRWWTTALSGLAGFAIGAMAIAPLTLPIATRLGGTDGNVAYSLTTTAPDLARFGIEVMRPTSPDRARAAGLLTDDIVKASADKSWGLGLGGYAQDQRRFRWQWGGNPGYSGLLVLEPERCDGVVVLTNGTGASVGRLIARGVLGADTDWRV